jgi:hypothetical protein
VPLQLPEDGAHRLVLNASAAGGRIRVQLLDAKDGACLSGYGLDDCVSIDGDGSTLPVAWKHHKVLPKGAVRMELEIARAGVFGFRAVPVDAGPSGQRHE